MRKFIQIKCCEGERLINIEHVRQAKPVALKSVYLYFTNGDCIEALEDWEQIKRKLYEQLPYNGR